VLSNTLTLRTLGTTTITATQAGNSNYFAATPVTNVLRVCDRIDYSGQIVSYPITNTSSYEIMIAGASGGGLIPLVEDMGRF